MRKFIHFILQLSKNDNRPPNDRDFRYLGQSRIFDERVCIKHARVYIRKACQFLLSPNKTFFYEIELVSYQCILILNYRENVVCILQQCNPFGTI